MIEMELKQESKTGEIKYQAFFVGRQVKYPRGHSDSHLLYEILSPEGQRIHEYLQNTELGWAAPWQSAINQIVGWVQEDLRKRLSEGQEISNIIVDIENDIPPARRKEGSNVGAVLGAIYAKRGGFTSIEDSADFDAKVPGLKLDQWLPYVTGLGEVGKQLCYREEESLLTHIAGEVKKELEEGFSKQKIKAKVTIK